MRPEERSSYFSDDDLPGTELNTFVASRFQLNFSKYETKHYIIFVFSSYFDGRSPSWSK